VSHYIKILSSAFEKERKLGYIPINPCLALDALVVEDSESREHFTLEQAEQLAAAAVGSDWEGVIWAAFYSGGRLQDVANLSWAEIDCTDPQKWWLRAKAKKTKALTHTPILGRFRAWLEKQRRGLGRAALFPSLANRTSGSNSGLSTEFKRLMERAGVRGRIIRQGDGKRRTTETLSFHSFRHSYASWLERNGVSEEDRMRLTGHATRKAHRNYVHSDPAILFDKLAAIEATGMAL
jgi:integrase